MRGVSFALLYFEICSYTAPGFRVFATARAEATIADLTSIGIEAFALDVNKPESITAMKKDIIARTGGKLDYLVNNAGRNYTYPALDIKMDEAYETFETNVFAVMRMCQAFGPLIINAKGTIVQIGSLAGVMYVCHCLNTPRIKADLPS